MSVWFAIPSARPAEEAAKRLVKWADQGYRIALLRQGEPVPAHLAIPTDHYLGWAQSTNVLAREILKADPEAEWIVGGGDDYLPDLTHRAEDIARECTEHFGGTFGLMQPTGDRWGPAPDRAYIDGIAGSPWMGREWCRRMYGGEGPMFGGYLHMFGDEELQNVAIKLGVFWQRRDLVQFHDHWGRNGRREDMPDFLRPVNTAQHWSESQRLFNRRRAAGWPGHEPIP